jgi:uncharacterized repeat protein (TIGR01451 family)
MNYRAFHCKNHIAEFNPETDLYEIPVGAPVIYTFVVSNSGNVPVVLTELSDLLISGALDDCGSALGGQTIEINGTLSCTSDSDPVIVAVHDTMENTATISVASVYGTTVEAQSRVLYTGILPDCVCTPENICSNCEESFDKILNDTGLSPTTLPQPPCHNTPWQNLQEFPYNLTDAPWICWGHSPGSCE